MLYMCTTTTLQVLAQCHNIIVLIRHNEIFASTVRNGDVWTLIMNLTKYNIICMMSCLMQLQERKRLVYVPLAQVEIELKAIILWPGPQDNLYNNNNNIDMHMLPRILE